MVRAGAVRSGGDDGLERGALETCAVERQLDLPGDFALGSAFGHLWEYTRGHFRQPPPGLAQPAQLPRVLDRAESFDESTRFRQFAPGQGGLPPKPGQAGNRQMVGLDPERPDLPRPHDSRDRVLVALSNRHRRHDDLHEVSGSLLELAQVALVGDDNHAVRRDERHPGRGRDAGEVSEIDGVRDEQCVEFRRPCAIPCSRQARGEGVGRRRHVSEG